MFVVNFTEMLEGMRATADRDTFMAYVTQDTVLTPTKEFISRMVAYARNLLQSPDTTVFSPRKFLMAFAISRFPVEMLNNPENPFEFTLLNKSNDLVLAIDHLLHQHNRTKDDTDEGFFTRDIATLFLHRLADFNAAFNEWMAIDQAVLAHHLQNVLEERIAQGEVQEDGPTA